MATWTDPPYAALVAGKAWTDAKASAAFENPIAIAEGAPGAPRIARKATQDAHVAFGTFDTVSALAVVGLGSIEKIRLDYMFLSSTTASKVQTAFSNDNGASWGTLQDILNPSSGSFSGVCVSFINLRTGELGTFTGLYPLHKQTTLTVPVNCNAIKLQAWSSGSGVVAATTLGGRL